MKKPLLLLPLLAASSASATLQAQQASGPKQIFWADFDADGLDDAFATGLTAGGRLMRNLGDGTFEDVTERTGLSGLAGAQFAAWGDLDGDDHVDLLVCDLGRSTQLYVNDGHGSFSDASERLGVAMIPSEHATLLDYDCDGRLDLHLRSASASQLYRGLGGGRFEVVAFEREFPLAVPVVGPFITGPDQDGSNVSNGGDDDRGLTLSGSTSRKSVVSLPSITGGGLLPATTPRNKLDDLYVNDNTGEVDSSDIADGSLVGADISTSSGSIAFDGASSSAQFDAYFENGINFFAEGPPFPSMTVNPSGNVGIGSLAPAGRLEVEERGAQPGLVISDPAGGQDAKIILSNATRDWSISADSSPDELVIGRTGLGVLGLYPDGSVGIGTGNPETRLHVFAPGGDVLTLQNSAGKANGSDRFITFKNHSGTRIGSVTGFDKAIDGTSAHLAELNGHINAIVNSGVSPMFDISQVLNLNPGDVVDLTRVFDTMGAITVGGPIPGPLGLSIAHGQTGLMGLVINDLADIFNTVFSFFGQIIGIGTPRIGGGDLSAFANSVLSATSLLPAPLKTFPLPGPSAFPTSGIDVTNLVTGISANPAGVQAYKDLICWALDNGLDQFATLDPLALAAAAATYVAEIECLDGGVTYKSTGADYAEWLPKLDVDERFTFGQLVGVHNGHISKVTEGADQIMSITFAPIVVGNTPPEGDEASYEMVAFMGQVPAIVVGGCESGDFIVPSGKNDGTAVAIDPEDLRADHLAMVLGRALEDSTSEEVGYVNTLVGVKTNEVAEVLIDQNARITELEARVAAMETFEARLSALEAGTGALASLK